MEKLDAVGNPIPENIQCKGTCSEGKTPHTHVRGRWNRPGYYLIPCNAPSSCSAQWGIDHWHKEDQ